MPALGGTDAAPNGKTATADEYVSTELFFWHLSFRCIDMGEALKLILSLKKKIRIGEDAELGKCAIMAISAWAEWVSQGQPKRCPSRARIDVMASNLRTREYIGAEKAGKYAEWKRAQKAQEIRSRRRDVLTARRGRGDLSIGLFFLPSIWKYLASEVAAIEIQKTGLLTCTSTRPSVRRMGPRFSWYPEMNI